MLVIVVGPDRPRFLAPTLHKPWTGCVANYKEDYIFLEAFL